MKHRILDFGDQLQAGAIGLFYYAGHGLQVNGQNYLVPIDANIEKAAHVRVEAVPLDDVLDQMEHAQSRLHIIILDACRNAPYGNRDRSWAGGAGGLATVTAPAGTWIAYATAPGRTADYGTGEHSPYTGALLDVIMQPGLEIGMVFRKVREQVRTATDERQVPWDAHSIIGEFWFLHGPTGDPTAAAATQPRAPRLWRVPALPPHFLDRPEDRQRVIDALCGANGKPVVIAAQKHGLHGMGGIGKSVLAAAVARDDAIREHYTDGIYWLTVGQTPQLTTLQAQLGRDLGMTDTAFDSPADGKHKLTAALADKRVLLVLDDVWQAEHAGPLDVVSEAGSLLVTTRNRQVLTGLSARDCSVDVLDMEAARQLLADWVGCPVTVLPEQAERVASDCGRLPLALSMIGGMVVEGMDWADISGLLADADVEEIAQEFPDYSYPSMRATLEASVNALPDELRERYIALAVFPEDEAIPEAALGVLWRVNNNLPKVRAIVRKLAGRSLVRRDDAGQIGLHDLQRMYLLGHRALARHGGIAALHGAFIDEYAERCPDGLAQSPEDEGTGGYFYKRSPYHLRESGRDDALRDLLGSYAWLDGKLRACGVVELLADFEGIADRDSQERGLCLIRDALRLSSHVLTRDVAQLPGQLVGRLDGFRDDVATVRSLLDSAHAEPTSPWLCPLVANLTPPGGPLLRTFEGHSSSVRAVALSEDGTRALSSSYDRTLKFLDVYRPYLRNRWNHTRPARATLA